MATDTESLMTSARTADRPLVMSATWRFDARDRRYIDNQIRALQAITAGMHINARIGTEYFVDPGLTGGLQKGDVVTLALLGADRVTRADYENFARTGAIIGIAERNAAAGSRARILLPGSAIPRSVTGLATNNPGEVRLSPSGRCQLVGPGTRLGYVNQSGVLQLDATATECPTIDGAIEAGAAVFTFNLTAALAGLGSDVARAFRLNAIIQQNVEGASQVGSALIPISVTQTAGVISTVSIAEGFDEAQVVHSMGDTDVAGSNQFDPHLWSAEATGAKTIAITFTPIAGRVTLSAKAELCPGPWIQLLEISE